MRRKNNPTKESKLRNINSAVQSMTVKGEYASVGDLKMYYEIHGTGRPLILLHGAFMSATVYPALAESRQVIAVDLQADGHFRLQHGRKGRACNGNQTSRTRAAAGDLRRGLQIIRRIVSA